MRRTGFQRPPPLGLRNVLARSALPLVPENPPPPRAVMATQLSQEMPVAIPKELAFRSEPYRRLVATLPCVRCAIEGYTQAAHMDFGKGEGTKVDDRLIYPACGPHPAAIGPRPGPPVDPGCHWLIGTSGHFTRDERRRIEHVYVLRTIFIVESRGLWIEGMPKPDLAAIEARL